jgi:hypothetical protein
VSRRINIAEAIYGGIYILIVVAPSICKQFSGRVTRIGLSLDCLTGDLIAIDTSIDRQSQEQEKCVLQIHLFNLNLLEYILIAIRIE